MDFQDIELTFLRNRVSELEEEKKFEKQEALKEVARRLVSRNMAYPIVRDIVGLPDGELSAIFYGDHE